MATIGRKARRLPASKEPRPFIRVPLIRGAEQSLGRAAHLASKGLHGELLIGSTLVLPQLINFPRLVLLAAREK